MKRFLFISNMAAPYQVKLCFALQKYFDCEFWFYVHIEKNRPDYWNIPLGNRCKILDGSVFIPGFNYYNIKLLDSVKKFNPDIIILDGFFFPNFYFIKLWAKRNNKFVIASTERISFENLNLFSFYFKLLFKKVILYLFRDIDLLFAMGEFTKEQHFKLFNFDERKIIVTHFPQDISNCFGHNLRMTREVKTVIFPNRLIEKYNPLFAIKVFIELAKKNDYLKLIMNNSGDLKKDCLALILANGLTDKVHFIDNINSWDDIHKIYRTSDIAIFTATDSNGPNTLIECLASGTGVVISDKIHNIQTYCLHEKNCFVSPLDIDIFVEYIERYLNIKDLITEHGKLSKELVKSRSIEETASFYTEIINKHQLK